MTTTRYKSTSKTQMAQAYNISTRTFRLWINPIKEQLGSYVGQTYNPKQVEQIVEFLGEPEKAEHVSV